MKGLLVALVVLAAMLVGADLVAVRVAEGVLAAQAQRAGRFAAEPSVDVRGFPFLTQAVSGRYDEVRLRSAGDVDGLQVESVDVALRGVRLPLSDALSGDVSALPVDGLRGEVVLGPEFLSERAPEGVTVEPSQDGVRVRGTVRVLGREVSAAAVSSVALEDDEVVVRARSFETGAGAVDGALERALGDRLDFRFAVPALPFGLRLSGLQARPEGLRLRADGGPTVLRPQESAAR